MPAANALRGPLLTALLLSAAAAFFFQPRVVEAVRADKLDAFWLAAAPGLFSLVVVLAALDAWRLARKRGYFSGPSVITLAVCVAFLGLLLPGTLSEYQARTSPPPTSPELYATLLKNRDPRVRALVMEVAGLRPDAPTAAPLVAQGLADKDPLVVDAAVRAVEQRTGISLDALPPSARVQKARELIKSGSTVP